MQTDGAQMLGWWVCENIEWNILVTQQLLKIWIDIGANFILVGLGDACSESACRNVFCDGSCFIGWKLQYITTKPWSASDYTLEKVGTSCQWLWNNNDENRREDICKPQVLLSGHATTSCLFLEPTTAYQDTEWYVKKFYSRLSNVTINGKNLIWKDQN